MPSTDGPQGRAPCPHKRKPLEVGVASHNHCYQQPRCLSPEHGLIIPLIRHQMTAHVPVTWLTDTR